MKSLFLLCTEGFHGLLKKAENMGDLKAISICRNDPKLTYLFFADDSLVFCRAKETECQKLLDILAKYERASEQQINREKTTLFFSKSTPHGMQEAIKNALGVPVVQQYEKYLGLPSFIGRNKKASFDNIKQRVWKKIQGWEGKLLPQASREILIKSILKLYPHTLCLVLSCRLVCAMKLKHLSTNFFGDKGGRAERCIG